MGKQQLIKLSLFSTEKDWKIVAREIATNFGIPETQNVLRKFELESDVVDLSVNVVSANMGTNAMKIIQNQKKGCINFFHHAPDKNKEIKTNLLRHISQMQTFVYIMAGVKEAGEDEAIRVTAIPLMKALSKLGGVLILDDGTTIADSNGNLILDAAGESTLEYYFPFSYEKNPEIIANCTEKQKQRRKRNMDKLFGDKIFCTELPLYPDEDRVVLRNIEEVGKRIFGLMSIALFAQLQLDSEFNLTAEEARQTVLNVISGFGIADIGDILTESEMEFFYREESMPEEKIKYLWRFEDLYCLEWAAGLTEWTAPSQMCDVNLVKEIIEQFESLDDFIYRAQFRSKAEIMDMADLSYRYDWIAFDAYVNKISAPADIKAEVTMERHKAFKWLINFRNLSWDDLEVSKTPAASAR